MTSCRRAGDVEGFFSFEMTYRDGTERGRYPFQKGDRISNLICSIKRSDDECRRWSGEGSGGGGGRGRKKLRSESVLPGKL